MRTEVKGKKDERVTGIWLKLFSNVIWLALKELTQ